ncbi:arsenate reductase family protein [Psychroflexus salis]|uniref:Arsenate reductase n=1 Tax=Psychroflexus salis TaxID=1526574 RepID=A0A916ZMJ7_9FLAO|nr:ArsC/Spx/MgsR family protein [Psychroflexus salis]GGE04852.1 arsenate reductase [Psychroflexus salis]
MKAYYLSTCSTCKRILGEIQLPESTTLIDIKKNPITVNQLEELYAHTNSYEALFNKRAQLYRKRELNTKKLSENDYKNLLLEHYSFLKRPVFVDQKQIFVGNAKSTIQDLKDYISVQ